MSIETTSLFIPQPRTCIPGRSHVVPSALEKRHIKTRSSVWIELDWFATSIRSLGRPSSSEFPASGRRERRISPLILPCGIATGDQLGVDIDLAHLVHDHGNTQSFAIAEQMIEQGRFSAAEKTGQNGDGKFLTVGHESV